MSARDGRADGGVPGGGAEGSANPIRSRGVSDGVDLTASGRAGARACPQRTCVGCRTRAAKGDLLRVVVVGTECLPDPHGRLPGRGASLHIDLGCLDLAERRRAFPRAFRRAGPLDAGRVRRYIEDRLAPADRSGGSCASGGGPQTW